MTRNEFIQKWLNFSTDTYEAMEFDLVSVINRAQSDEMERHIEKRYGEGEEPEQKACAISNEEAFRANIIAIEKLRRRND